MNVGFNQAGIEAALEYAGGTHTYEHVREAIIRGELQYWERGDSVLVTELEHYPLKKVCHLFLAGGSLEGLRKMLPGLERWAIAQGCKALTLTGRLGWQRSFLVDDGYAVKWCSMAKELSNGQG